MSGNSVVRLQKSWKYLNLKTVERKWC